MSTCINCSKELVEGEMVCWSCANPRVIYARFVYPDNGYKSQSEYMKQHFKVGDKYIVKDADVGRYFTDVYLEGINGCFNSVFFEYSDDRGNPVDIIKEYCNKGF